VRARVPLALAADAGRALEARPAVDAVTVRDAEVARAGAVLGRLADARGAVDRDALAARQEAERAGAERARDGVREEERLAREGGPRPISADAVGEELHGVRVGGTRHRDPPP